MYQVPPTVAKVRKRACATQIFRTCLGDIAHWSASFRPRLVNTQLKKRARGGGALVEENTSKKKGRQSFLGASAALPPLKALESTATVRGLSLSSLPLPVPTTRSWDQLSVGHDWRWPFTCAEFYDDFFFNFSSFYYLYFLEIRRRQFLFQLDFRHCFFIRRNLVKCWTFNCVSVETRNCEIIFYCVSTKKCFASESNLNTYDYEKEGNTRRRVYKGVRSESTTTRTRGPVMERIPNRPGLQCSQCRSSVSH